MKQLNRVSNLFCESVHCYDRKSHALDEVRFDSKILARMNVYQDVFYIIFVLGRERHLRSLKIVSDTTIILILGL